MALRYDSESSKLLEALIGDMQAFSFRYSTLPETLKLMVYERVAAHFTNEHNRLTADIKSREPRFKIPADSVGSINELLALYDKGSQDRNKHKTVDFVRSILSFHYKMNYVTVKQRDHLIKSIAAMAKSLLIYLKQDSIEALFEPVA